MAGGAFDCRATRIIGQVETNANGNYVRLENGLQVCWRELRVAHSGSARSLGATWTYPQPFVDAPVVPAPALPTSSAKYAPGLALASLGHPFTAAGPTATNTSVYVWENSSPFTSGQWIDLMVLAVGRWK